MQPNVRYELQELEQLLGSDCHKTVEKLGIKTTSIETIKQEIDRIKQTFIYEVFTFEDERHLERYIQYHQQALVLLMDKAMGLLKHASTTHPNEKNFLSIYYNGLEELLTFVERHFTKYFDLDAKAPLGYITIARKDAQTNVRKLQKSLTTTNADAHLIDLMLHPMQRIIQKNPQLNTTYRKVLYAKEVQKELFRMLRKTHEAMDVNEELRLIMYYLNYNSVRTSIYHASYINSLLCDAETRTEKIEKLSFILKKINQTQVKPGIRYNHNSPPLKGQLNNYIIEEIDYLERLQHLTNQPSAKPLDSFLQSFKLKLEMSVAQLAFLIRVCIETKLIRNNNVTEILRFLVRFVMTKRSESISYDSFRAKFYNMEQGTKESVKSILLTMVRFIEKN